MVQNTRGCKACSNRCMQPSGSQTAVLHQRCWLARYMSYVTIKRKNYLHGTVRCVCSRLSHSEFVYSPRFSRKSFAHLSNMDRISMENTSKDIRKTNKDRSNIYRTSIENQSKIYQHLSNIYRTSIEHQSKRAMHALVFSYTAPFFFSCSISVR